MELRVSEAFFRASRQYELVAYERLPVSERQTVHDCLRDPDFYGFLRPVHSDKPVKAVCKDTALLFLTLLEPSQLPSYIKNQLGGECEKAIMDLVFDGILELDWKGAFISGPSAMALLRTTENDSNPDKISQLSVQALLHAQLLQTKDARALWSRLYLFGKDPLTPALQRALGSIDRVKEFLGLGPLGTLRSSVEMHWRTVPQQFPEFAWIAFKTASPSHNDLQNSPFTYKLYVSPTLEALEQAFGQVVQALAEGPPCNFKVARDIQGLLRADKLVAYYPNFEQLYEAVQSLKDKLIGIPAQGVPFSASLSDDGLLSWGVDPPARPHDFDAMENDSWRSWVTRRLAEYLAVAKSMPSEGLAPWRYAVSRLQSDGVDTRSWIPPRQLWQASQ